MSQLASKNVCITFKDPVPVRRPKKSHLYYVWSPKRGKIISLYGQFSLYYWIVLESSSTVSYFCERPFRLPIEGKKIIASFWTEGRTNNFIFLTSEKRKDKLIDTINQCKSFIDFCTDRSIQIDVFSAEDIKITATFYHNWQTILQQVAANKDEISSDLQKEVCDYFQQYHSCSLGQLYALFELDPVIVRATVFELIRKHKLCYQEEDNVPINDKTIVNWNPQC